MNTVKTFGIAAATALLAAGFTAAVPAPASAQKGMRGGGGVYAGGHRAYAGGGFRGGYRGAYRGYRGGYAYRGYRRGGNWGAAFPLGVASGLMFGLAAPAFGYGYGYPAYGYDYGYPYYGYPATYGYAPGYYAAPRCVMKTVRVYRHGWKWAKQRYCY